MPKEFYTERDIEDMVRRGILSLEINDDVVLTEMAYEKANRLGMKLVRQHPENPPSAPVRPYVNQRSPVARPAASSQASPARPSVPSPATSAAPSSQASSSDLHARIRSAVVARLGNQVDSGLLDVIITRVLNSTGVK